MWEKNTHGISYAINTQEVKPTSLLTVRCYSPTTVFILMLPEEKSALKKKRYKVRRK